MPWKIHYHPITELPKLMWVAAIRAESETVTVFHGPAVECRDEWMVEGIWDGEFSRGEFHRSESFFGSGLRIEGDRLYCVASSALVDRLFYCRHEKTTVVSNSLVLLLAFTDSKLDPGHDYNVESFAIMQGLDRYKKEFTIRNPRIDRFFQFYHDNMVIEGDRISFERRSRVRDVASFEQYHALLQEVLLGLKRCYTSPERRVPLDAFATLSSGYDSTAVACLAREIGVKTCFTSQWSNSAVPAWLDRRRGVDDGGPIAAALGLQTLYLSPPDASSADDELYFYAAAPAKAELVFHSMAAHIEKTCQAAVVFSGYHGDKMWDSRLEQKYLNDQIMRGDISGLRLAEIRLKSGFIHVALPFLFARSVASISKISDSPEMEPWRLHNSYDRPIARRIAESAGVPRRLFGFQKKMVTKSEPYPVNAQLRKRFFEFLHTHYRLRPGLVHLSIALSKAAYVVLRASSHLPPVKRSKSLLSWTHTRLGWLERKRVFGKNLDLQGLLFLWATDVLARNTAVILQKDLGSPQKWLR